MINVRMLVRNWLPEAARARSPQPTPSESVKPAVVILASWSKT